MITQQDIEDFADSNEYYHDHSYEEEYKSRMTPLDMVKEYAKVAGQPLNEDWPWDQPEPQDHLIKLELMRWGLVNEEYQEFEHACGGWSPNSHEVLKELADLVYVCYGYAATFGFDLDTAVQKIHKNNLARMYQDDGTIHYREDGKIIKNPNTPKVDLKDCL